MKEYRLGKPRGELELLLACLFDPYKKLASLFCPFKKCELFIFWLENRVLFCHICDAAPLLLALDIVYHCRTTGTGNVCKNMAAMLSLPNPCMQMQGKPYTLRIALAGAWLHYPLKTEHMMH